MYKNIIENITMEKIILSTTSSFTKAVTNSDLEGIIKKSGFRHVLIDKINPPFDFDPKAVFAVVAGTGRIFSEDEIRIFPNLKIILPFGAGIDHIDINAANKYGVIVQGMPGINRHAVAELTIGYLFSLSRNIHVYNNDLKNKIWNRVHGYNIAGKKLGIVGLGNIGKEVARLACGLGMNVSACDIKYDEEFLSQFPKVQKENFNSLISDCDFISLHVPLSESTRGMINHKTINAMKLGVYLINTSRGEVINEKDLLEALKQGKIQGAALDVYSEEPPFANPVLAELISQPRVICSPHTAAFTPETHYRVASKIIETVVAIENSAKTA